MKWLLAGLVIWLAWRLLAKRAPGPVRPVADEMAARRVLGVAPDADEPAIREAHRRKVAAVHPDRGGSDEATRELNAARDLLLDRPA